MSRPTAPDPTRLAVDADLAASKGLTIATGAAPIPAAPATIPEAVAAAARGHGTTEALVGVDQRIAYADLAGRVGAAAQALVELGIGPGDRVAASLANCAELPIMFFAVQRLGAIWVGVNQALATPEQRYILGHAEARLLLADAATVQALGAAGGELPDLARAVMASATGEVSEWSELVAAARPFDEDRPLPHPHLPAGIAYTSGTTGFPKGAVHSQHNMLVPAVVQRDRGSLVPGTRAGQALPLTILNIMIVGPVTTLVAGATMVAIDRNSARGIVDWAQRERLDAYLVAPPTVHDLVADEGITRADLAGVARPGCGGAGVTEELRAAFEQKFGRRFSVGYGMTEAPTSIVFEPEDQPTEPGACGVVNPQVAITVRDDDGNLVPAGEDGEFCLAGRDDGPWAGVYTPMLGYWRQPDATAAALGAGYYRTGDVGHFDAAGRCHVRARRSEMVLRGGTNIYPAEIERIILLHPDVRACAVLGRPHDRLGEELVAVLEPHAGHAVDVAAVRELCATNLSRYKVPAEFVVVDALPRNQMDKVVRNRIRTEVLGL